MSDNKDYQQMPTYLNNVYDKFKGIIFGCAIGSNINKNNHIQSIDHMLLLLNSAYFDERSIMTIDNNLFASKLVLWKYNGMPEINTCNKDYNDPLISELVDHPRYTIQPTVVTGTIHADSEVACSNALSRISVLALSGNYMQQVMENCLTTDFDNRCITSCLMQCGLIRKILKDAIITESDIKKLHDSTYLSDEHYGEYNEYFNVAMEAKIFPDISIFDYVREIEKKNTSIITEDNNNFHDYVFVSAAIMLWGLRSAIGGKTFSEIIGAIKDNDKFANVNAAITGAVLGAYFGYRRLPIAELYNDEFIADRVDEFLRRN